MATSTAVPVAPIAAAAAQPVAASDAGSHVDEEPHVPYGALKHLVDSSTEADATEAAIPEHDDEHASEDADQSNPDAEPEANESESHQTNDEDQSMLPQYAHEEVAEDDVPAAVQSIKESSTSVEQRLKQISEEVEKQNHSDNDGDIGQQSFFSLSDLIKTLRPSDRKVSPQIDSDYSNTMRVLGETASVAGAAEGRQMKGVEISTAPRAHH